MSERICDGLSSGPCPSVPPWIHSSSKLQKLATHYFEEQIPQKYSVTDQNQYLLLLHHHLNPLAIFTFTIFVKHQEHDTKIQKRYFSQSSSQQNLLITLSLQYTFTQTLRILPNHPQNSESISQASFGWLTWTYITINILRRSTPILRTCNNHLSNQKVSTCKYIRKGDGRKKTITVV